MSDAYLNSFQPMTVTQKIEQLEAERASLITANHGATGWGAAVGERSARIVAIERSLADLKRSPHVFAGEHPSNPPGTPGSWAAPGATPPGQKPPADAPAPEAPADSASRQQTPLERARAKMRAESERACRLHPIIEQLTKDAAELAGHMMIENERSGLRPSEMMLEFPKAMLHVATALLAHHATVPEFTPEERAALVQEVETIMKSKKQP